MKRTTRVSLGDVAREAGVSRMTVSLALRENGRLQATTAERVRAAAKRLGYMPNPRLSQVMAETARTRHGGQSGTLAFLTTEPINHPHLPDEERSSPRRHRAGEHVRLPDGAFLDHGPEPVGQPVQPHPLGARH